MLKFNIGSHNKRIAEYENVDILPLDNVDIVADCTQKWGFAEDESVDEIIMEEFLEHISFRQTDFVLREAYRVLKVGGKLHIQVPDIKQMMIYYMENQICDCVPHKPKSVEDARANPNCVYCGGNGKINPTRWKFAFLGAQKHDYDLHRNIFTPESIEESLESVGFNKITINHDEYYWKIKVNAEK